ncbi:cupin domain-containing protein [Marinobacter lutaoensis]|jgi:50S ribosomal protein L16 3-hydroxylase|uniref:cupin domain-containing protein n=1 Tax=Marinobacter lutaoensis TaxID=135739 RepID=UPI000C0B53AA|nr:cupin domain-containing protein [Marinobacter lutaoensis]MBE02663.1 transcription factor [Marinobacter sp.]MBI42667.1 transcription factor [Oceanospirillales bacterium]NVD35387.1 cupin domain-containing protein [Marinobacter lutaoensis]|tara:strand:+ start:2163 stop:3314 length:1152 start_codon:yes stop_codon:yes gene_type:complete
MDMLGGLTPSEFLRDYWQKKPRVIRQAFPGFQCPVSADELAGLACEQGVESRIIIENEDGKPWQLYNGPFEPDRFQQLPEQDWTLLVQGLDHWVPEIADLLDHFRFVPNWRLDDIMASYAPRGGSVGPHYDQYDVFLLQAQGHRRWTFGGHCDHTSPRVEGTPLRILSHWEGEETVTLAPGDMLYLPPGIGHHGVAEDDCITLSVGFRAPTVDDILTGFTDFLCGQSDAAEHLSDPDLQIQDNPGIIAPRVIDRIESLIRERLLDRRQLVLWFGQYTTAPKSLDIVVPPDDPAGEADLAEAIRAGEQLRWNEGSRFAYHDLGEETALFVDGEHYLLRGDARPLAPLLCAGARIPMAALAPLAEDSALLGLITALYNQGSVYFE